MAETIRLAVTTGLVGGSIEDATGDKDKPLYDFDYAVERIAAAVEAGRALPFSAIKKFAVFDPQCVRHGWKRSADFPSAS